MTTNDDILAALNGTPTAADQTLTDGILEALGQAPAARAAAAGELPVQSRGDLHESVAIWAAQEAATAATKRLAEAIMRADGNKGIYLAEAEAKQIADEAYGTAAKQSPYEEDRQQTVARVTAKLAETIGRTRANASESTPTLGKTLLKRRSVQANGRSIIEYYA